MLMGFMQNIKRAVDVQTVVLPMLNVQESLELDVKDLQMNEENARAMAVGWEAGEAAEQERIINLLKDRHKRYTAKHYIDGIMEMEELIALIKGEDE
jgi:hypothetical protein